MSDESQPIDLRCPNTLHGVVERGSGTIEVKCRHYRCGARSGVVVLHRFDLASGRLIDTRKFKDPRKEVKRQHGARTSASVRTA